MKIYRILILIALIILSSCSQHEKKCTLSGEVINRPESKYLILTKAFKDLRAPDTVRISINHGKFLHDLYYSNEEAYKLVFEDEHKNGCWSTNYFFPTNGKVNVILYNEADEVNNRITGGKENYNYNEYQKNVVSRYDSLYDNYNAKFESLRELGKYESDTVKSIRKLISKYQTNSVKQRELFMQLSTLRNEQLDLTDEAKIIENEFKEKVVKLNAAKLAYIDKNPSIATYFCFVECLKESSEMYDAIYCNKLTSKFIDKYKSHPYSLKLSEKLVTIGKKYFDITLTDLNGVPHTLSNEISGKFAIIDIWAPWCGGCLTKSRALKTVYKEFKKKNFEIIGIASKYYNVDDVDNTLKRENNSWTTLIDKPNWESEINIKYDILNAGGKTILVDNKGIVLATNPSIEFIRKTLKENLK